MDIIIINAKIHTMDSDNSVAEAVLIRDDRFAQVGSNEEVLSLKQEDTKVIDLKGKTVVPGFNDSHMHFAMFGSTLQECNLDGVRSVEELIERAQAFIAENEIPEGQWVVGKGWNQDYFESKAFPSRFDIDKISTKHPITFMRAGYHSYVVNTKALEVAGIDETTPQVESGQFDVDERGYPTGMFRENAMGLISACIPKPELEDIKKMILDASEYAVAQGITSIQTDDFMLPNVEFETVLRAYAELIQENQLKVRICEQCLFLDAESFERFLEAGHRTGDGDNRFRIGPLKLLADGNLGNRTSAMVEPYADDPTTTGIAKFSQDQLDLLVSKANDNNMNVAIHCIGDRATYMSMESFRKAQRLKPEADIRNGIVHCQILDDELIDNFRDQNVVAYIQPLFLNYDIHCAEDRVGPDRIKTSYNWRTMVDQGIHIACGTDCPVEPMDVMPNIHCAVNRQDFSGYPEAGWYPEQGLTVEESVYAYTMGSAYASYEEDQKGSIETGKLADLVVLSEDIFTIDPKGIMDVQVEMTMIGGELVYVAG